MLMVGAEGSELILCVPNQQSYCTMHGGHFVNNSLPSLKTFQAQQQAAFYASW